MAMVTTTPQPPEREQCLVLGDASWRHYRRLGRLLRDKENENAIVRAFRARVRQRFNTCGHSP
jgi:hypothetical protein